MAIVKFRDQFPNLFDRFFNDDFFDWSVRNFSGTNTTLPSINIKEDKNGFEVEVAAPGLEKEDFKIDLNEETLTISSEKKVEEETKDKECRYTRREFSYQSFTRSLSLPSNIDREKISAKYEKGVLRVSIPKKEAEKPKPAKKIEIL